MSEHDVTPPPATTPATPTSPTANPVADLQQFNDTHRWICGEGFRREYVFGRGGELVGTIDIGTTYTDFRRVNSEERNKMCHNCGAVETEEIPRSQGGYIKVCILCGEREIISDPHGASSSLRNETARNEVQWEGEDSDTICTNCFRVEHLFS